MQYHRGIYQCGTPKAIIQSFDVRALQYIHRTYPHIRLSYLVHNQNNLGQNLQRLGFLPDVYRPEYKMVTPKLVREIRALNISLIPWTIDKTEDIKRLIALGIKASSAIIQTLPRRN